MSTPNKKMSGSALAEWLGFGIGLGILGGAIAANLYFQHGRMMVREHDRLSTQARVLAENLESQLASANRALEDVRGDFPRWKESSGLQLRLKAITNTMQGVRTINVMDAEGKILASNWPELIGNNFGYRDYFRAAKQHPDPDVLYVSPPFKTALGVFSISLTRVVSGSHGEFAGIVTATLDPEYFRTLMASVLYAPDMWDAIVHGDGLLFLMVPERQELLGMSLVQPGSLFSQHRDSGQKATVLSGTVYSTREERMMAQRTVHPETFKMDKPLVVAVGRDLDAIFQPWRRGARAEAGFFGLVVVVSFVGFYAYQRHQQKFERQAAEAAAALRRIAERLQLATEVSGIGVWDYDIVTSAVVWDDSMYAIYGIDKAVAGASLYEAWQNSILPEDRVEEATARQAAIEKGVPYTPCFHIRRGDGSLRCIQARARFYADAGGKAVRMVGTNEDITERGQREAALQESEERFRSTFDAAAIGMALVSLPGRFLQVNGALCRIVGYTPAELQQKTFQEITHPNDLEADLLLRRELMAGIRDSFQMEKRYLHKDGHAVWILLSASAVRDSTSKTLYLIAQIQDVTERRAMLEKLELQANQDYLTGLSNRRHFLEQGVIELARVQRYGEALSAFMLDIDYFKKINDTYGHRAGDIVLQKLSHLLRETLRTVDIIGRMGGEEFAVLLPETDLQEAAEIAERLREIIAHSDVILEAGLPLHFTVSIGVATLKEEDINLDILLNLADKALYQAKESGRNKVCVSA